MKAAYRTKEVYLPDRGDTRDPKAVRHSKSKAKSQLPSHEVLCWPGLPGWLWQDMSWRNLSQKNLSFRGLLTLNICLRIQFQLHLPKRLMPKLLTSRWKHLDESAQADSLTSSWAPASHSQHVLIPMNGVSTPRFPICSAQNVLEPKGWILPPEHWETPPKLARNFFEHRKSMISRIYINTS